MKKIIITIAIFSLTSIGFAAGIMDKLPPKVQGSDNSSGCGYGWEVTKGKSLSASSTRASTNSTASNTIAMTMGTSGCEKHGIVKVDRMQEAFAEINYENILADIAVGQGEYLATFSQVMGCEQETFANIAQQNLKDLATTDAHLFLNNVRGIIKNNAQLKTRCI